MAYLTDLISDLAIFNIFIHCIKSISFETFQCKTDPGLNKKLSNTVYKILIVQHILCTWAEGKV